MKRTLVLLGAAICVCANVQAVIGSIDFVPAATLLLPYFEVEPGDESGLTTQFTVNNASPASVMAKVTLWTDIDVPTLNFDVTMAGSKSLRIDLQEIFAGNLPNGDTLDANAVQALVDAHTGAPDGDSLCSGASYDDGIARGYVTVDVVNETSLQNPSAPGYFLAGGQGIASNLNALWGDFELVDSANNFSQGELLVHIEASDTDPLVTIPGNYTFYGRYVQGTASDNREPLPTRWNAEFDLRDETTAGTTLIFWQDSLVDGHPLTCGFPPQGSVFPLTPNSIIARDDEGEFVPFQDTPELPVACGRVDLAFYQPGAERGTVELDTNDNSGGAPFFLGNRQSYIIVIQSSEGRFSSGALATPLTYPAVKSGGAGEP